MPDDTRSNDAPQARLGRAGLAATAALTAIEIASVRLRHPVAIGDTAWLALATAALTALVVAALGLALLPLVRWRPIRRALLALQSRPAARIGTGGACLAAAVAAHAINATQYVRLYMSIHLALSLATALAMLAGFATLMPARPPMPSSRRLHVVVAAAVLAWCAALAASLVAITGSHRLRFAAVEQTTLLWHELWAFDAVTGVLAPVDDAPRADAVPDELLAPLRAAPPAPASGIARGANIVLITVDSLRADRLGDALPHIEALRRESIELSRAYSPSCSTVHAISSIMTSHYPTQIDYTYVSVDRSYRFTPHDDDSALVDNPLHGRKTHQVPLRDAHPTLAELLAAGGYQTATVAAYIYYLRGAGITRGFEVVDEDVYKRNPIDPMGVTPVDMVARAGAFLDARDSERPFFLWLHFMEPHAPYEARDDRARGGDAATRYDSELRYVDAQLGALRERLPANTIIALHADHGEELGDHGGAFHGTTCYDEIVRVPWLMRVPGMDPQSIAMPVGLIDLAPTLLDLAGVDADTPLMGRTLVPLFRGEPVVARPVLTECIPPGRLLRGLVAWPYKLIVDRELGTVQLYDLLRDPRERRNLADAEPEALASLRALLAAIETRVLRGGGGG